MKFEKHEHSVTSIQNRSVSESTYCYSRRNSRNHNEIGHTSCYVEHSTSKLFDIFQTNFSTALDTKDLAYKRKFVNFNKSVQGRN